MENMPVPIMTGQPKRHNLLFFVEVSWRGEAVSWPFPTSRGQPHSLVCGAFLHPQSEEQSIFKPLPVCPLLLFSHLLLRLWQSYPPLRRILLILLRPPSNPGQSSHLMIVHICKVPSAMKITYSQDILAQKDNVLSTTHCFQIFHFLEMFCNCGG